MDIKSKLLQRTPRRKFWRGRGRVGRDRGRGESSILAMTFALEKYYCLGRGPYILFNYYRFGCYWIYKLLSWRISPKFKNNNSAPWNSQSEREMFYLTTHSTHSIYGYMASDIWLRTILIVRKETRCRHIDYSYQLTARVLLYAPSHRQDNTYRGLCYTSRGALAGTRNSSVGSQSEWSA